jgi:anti-sigma factor RsiW
MNDTETGNREIPEHDEVSEWLGAYAIGGLEPEETIRVRLHLESCEVCRQELAELEGLHELLEASTLAEKPPPHLEEAVLEAIARAPVPGRPADHARQPYTYLSRSPLRRRRSRSAIASSLAVAAMAVLFAAIAVQQQVARQEQEASVAPVQTGTGAAPSPARPSAGALRLVAAEQGIPTAPAPQQGAQEPSVEVPSIPPQTSFPSGPPAYPSLPGGELTPRKTDAGWECDITVWGLQPGRLYEVWFKTHKGVISGGSFVPSSAGIFTVHAYTGIPLREVQEVIVTEEPYDGDPTPSGIIVLRGQLQPSAP